MNDGSPADNPVVTDNEHAGRFELRRADGELLSWAEYTLRGDVVVVPHVETAREHRGNDFAARLMDGVLDLVRSADRTITPLCSYAAGHIRTRPQHHDLLT